MTIRFPFAPLREIFRFLLLRPLRSLRLIVSSHRRAQAAAVMRQFQMIENRAQRHDARRVDVQLAVVTFLDLLQIERLFNPRPLIKLAQVIGEIRIILNAPQVALEVAVVNQVETQKRRKGAPVGLGDTVAGQIAPLAELLDRKSTRLNSSHSDRSRMPSSA